MIGGCALIDASVFLPEIGPFFAIWVGPRRDFIGPAASTSGCLRLKGKKEVSMG